MNIWRVNASPSALEAICSLQRWGGGGRLTSLPPSSAKSLSLFHFLSLFSSRLGLSRGLTSPLSPLFCFSFAFFPSFFFPWWILKHARQILTGRIKCSWFLIETKRQVVLLSLFLSIYFNFYVSTPPSGHLSYFSSSCAPPQSVFSSLLCILCNLQKTVSGEERRGEERRGGEGRRLSFFLTWRQSGGSGRHRWDKKGIIREICPGSRVNFQPAMCV